MSYVLVYGSEEEYARYIKDILEANGLRIVDIVPEPASMQEAIASLGRYKGQATGVVLLYTDTTVMAYLANNMTFSQYLVADPIEDEAGFRVDVYSMYASALKLFTARPRS